MADPGTRIYDRCRCCASSVYLNQHPARTVDVWVHAGTGSRHCLAVEGGLAEPVAA